MAVVAVAVPTPLQQSQRYVHVRGTKGILIVLRTVSMHNGGAAFRAAR